MTIKKRYVYLALWFLLCGLLTLDFFNTNLKLIATVSFIIVILAAVRTLFRDGLISATMAYVFLFAMFHLTTPIAVFLLGLAEPLKEFTFLGSNLLVDASALALFGLVAFQVGAELGAKEKKINSGDFKPIRTSKERSIFTLSFVLLILFCVAYILLGLQSGLLIGGKQVLVEMRGAGGGESRVFGITGELLTIFAFITIAFAPRKYLIFLIAIPVAIFLPMFLSGKRGSFIVMLAAMLIVVSKRGVKISPFYIAAGILTLLFVVSYMRRTIIGGADFASEWYLNAVYEMGQQIQVVMYTIDAIRSNITKFWFGTSYLWGLWGVIPNIGGIRGLFERADPGIWISEIYANGEVGLGYSSVAEAYLNFGWPGVFVIMGAIGFLLSRSERFAMQSPYVLAIYGATLGGLFFAIRGDASGVFRPIVWTWLILKTFRVIVHNLKDLRIAPMTQRL